MLVAACADIFRQSGKPNRLFHEAAQSGDLAFCHVNGRMLLCAGVQPLP